MTWECVVWDLDGTLVRSGSPTPAPGVRAVLEALHAAGTVQAVATSAPRAAARALIAELGWDHLIGHVAGSAPGLAGKDDLVAEALLGLGRPLPAGAHAAALVGDAPADMAAARRHGLVAVGAAWDGAGAAQRSALRESGAQVVVTDPASIPTGPSGSGT